MVLLQYSRYCKWVSPFADRITRWDELMNTRVRYAYAIPVQMMMVQTIKISVKYLPTTSTHTHSGNKCTRVCGGWVAVKEIEKILSSQLISLHCPALWLVQSHVSWAAIGGPMQPRCWLVFMRNICWLISWKINGGSSMWGYSETQHRRILHSHVVVVFRDAT